MRRLHCAWLGILAASGCARTESPLPVVGTLERERLELIAEAREPIVEILAAEGDRVGQGQVVVRLDPAVHEARLAAARAEARRASQRLAELVRGPRQERILDARARVDGAREDLATQEREFERVAELLERALATPSDVDRAHARRELAEAELERATAMLDELLEGTTPEELGQAEASVDAAAARVDELEIARARLDVTAPLAGVLEALPYEAGERPPEGAAVAVMLSDAAPYARIYVPEPIRARVTPGLGAEVFVDGFAGSFSGRVRYVAADAAFTPYFALTQRDRSRLSYLAEITVDDPAAANLPAGIPVEVDFPSLAPGEP